MSEITRTLFPIAFSLALCGIGVLLARRADSQFACGSIALFLAAFVVSVAEPNIFVQTQPGFWQGAYSATFPFLSTLYAIAHFSIWRSFRRPAWMAFLAAVPFTWFFASVGFWENIV
jgi:hypothetical protein